MRLHYTFILCLCAASLLAAEPKKKETPTAEEEKPPASALPESVTFKLPTLNRNLLAGNLSAFYQPTSSRRLESGMFGYVRSTEEGPNPKLLNIYHEGIDIQPVARSSSGDPKDDIMASADGIVVYTNPKPQFSNYGRYIVIEHRCQNYTLYTLYAHLASVNVSIGDEVKQGQRIGRMGYSGAGISKDRAHLHFEIDLLVNLEFPVWFDLHPDYDPRDPNFHGVFNGINLIGIDPARMLLKGEAHQPTTLADFFASEKPLYTVRVPAKYDYFCFQRRFPSIVENGIVGSLPKSWEIDFTPSGMPVKFKRSELLTEKVELIWFDYSRNTQESLSHGYVKRTGEQSAELTKQGLKWIDHLTYLSTGPN